MDKYRRLRRHVATSDDHAGDALLVPTAANLDELARCHCPKYVAAVHDGTLTRNEIRRIGFPWSPAMAERSRRSTGATIAAARAALIDGVAANLAGGTHHAFADAGEGYCVFNDAAVAIRTLQAEGLIRRACVIDLDVHQGNGTAAILADDPTAITLSIHGKKNFPLRKRPSDLDVDLPDGTGDEAYLETLRQALDQLSKMGPYDLAIYLAGADPYLDDRLGRLALTKRGLAQRDREVFRWAAEAGIAVAVAMAGGYARSIDDIVEIHAGTLRVASQACRGRVGARP
jgi:acetoin utilization deacetylase AcuC-like enzyme